MDELIDGQTNIGLATNSWWFDGWIDGQTNIGLAINSWWFDGLIVSVGI